MYPQAYINYLVHFHGDRDYFECHEVLEEHWKSAEKEKRELVWVGLIQIAVSLYHHRRGNLIGAERTMNKAIAILDKQQTHLSNLGLDPATLLELLHTHLRLIKKKCDYSSFNLPINDVQLVNLCKGHPLMKQFVWLSPSDLQNEAIINRHKLRDRSDIIAERAYQLQKKQSQR
ncbi:DUF309 domain-containing protein [Priestia megaterium]|nr:DUF309 domain-containing protein [Priestia megaterium]